jgi:hypothetical protein
MLFESIKRLVQKGIIPSDAGKSLAAISSRLPERKKDNFGLMLGLVNMQEEELMEWSDNSLVEFSDGSNVIW